jgi:SepF-like predicted cell division protein (DUF552 family)
MSVSSESSDGSDIFWPGYVDAVTNLAINLLFVIAVMSIITLATSLELMKKPKNLESTGLGGGKATETMAMAEALEKAEKKVIEVTEAAAKDAQAAKKEIAKLEAQQKKDSKTTQSASTAVAAVSEKSTEQARTETVTAKQTSSAPDGKATVRPVDGGLVVVFEPSAVQLSEEESADVAKKLATFGPVATSKWQIAVVTPKGYSVASRLAFYRVNAVRSVLLKNGAQGSNIETRVIESDQPTANNARVTVQRLN